MASFVTELANPDLVARFQKWCGVELVADDSDVAADDNQDADSLCSKESGIVKDSVTLCLEKECRSCTVSATDHEKYSSVVNNNNNFYDEKLKNNGVHNSDQADVNQCYNELKQRLTGTNLPVKNGLKTEKHSATDPGCRAKDTECSRVNGVRLPKAPESCTNHRIQKAVGESAATRTRVNIRYPLLYYWAKVGAFLGNEEFYLTGLPFLLWTVDSAMVRQTVVVWWLVMYVGQASKDYLAWPRPPCPPVLRLEATHLAEYSMPSTHAMAGTAIPLLLARLLLQRYQLPAIPVMCLAFLWCFTTCLSRLYLGVHTVLDLAVGCLVSLALYFLVSPLTAGYDLYQQTHPLAPLVLVLTSLALCTVLYPSCPGKTSAKNDAITITAVLVGLGVGVWLNFQLGLSHAVPSPEHIPVSVPTLGWLVKSLCQFGVGVGVVYGVKVVMKPVAVRFFSSVMFGLDRPEAQHPGVKIGATYTTYLCLGITIAFLDPLIFSVLGFGRPAYYLEVL